MIEAIIFDMDGTLVDTEPIHTDIEKRQFARYNLVIREEEHQKFVGVATEAMWFEIASRYKMSKPAEQLIAENNAESVGYFSSLAEIPVMPGLVELLEEIWKENCLMAVASSSTSEMIDLILTKTGLKKYFTVMVSAEESGKSKPEPDVFLLAAKKLGVDPKNCLVVEDSKNGIKAALSAGMKCIAYTNSNDERDAHGADGVIHHFSELRRFL